MNLKKIFGNSGFLLSGLFLLTSHAIPASAEVVFNVDAGRRSAAIGDLHYGIFFEEINHAGDGGLYAELVRNRSFEDATSPSNWQKSQGVTWKLIKTGLLNDAQANALEVTFPENGGYIANEGYWGMNAVEGDTYTLTFWAKSDAGFNGNIRAMLVDTSGNSLGEVTLPVVFGKDWKQYSATFNATGNNPKAKLRLASDKAGTFDLDVVSLFPPTYKNRPNGCRIDLAEKLAAMRPAFVRFPGGCFIEGTSRDGLTNRFEWKNTIGGIETRPGHMNVNWNYRVSDGMGFHEMLQLTEDLGAEPLYVVNIGLGHGWSQPYDQLDEFVQEALDAIEYCNGDVNTRWGAVRAANGHPEPFNLRLIEIGNENYQANVDEQSDHYAERYRTFYDAIKAKYPEILCIGNVESWGTDNPSWRNNNPVDAVDEHYYRNPDWFAATYNKYDSYDRKGPKVYAGEYAVTSDFGNTGSLRAALGEAIYMLGMERNSDICVMGSYAPIFVNENDQRWMPDMIRFNSSESYGTPSYYVQSLFPNNVGKQNVRWAESNNKQTIGHKVGFSTWSTAAEYDNVKITDLDGNIVYTQDFSTTPSDWTLPSGWTVDGGVIKRTDTNAQGGIAFGNTDAPENFIFEFDATKTAGVEGFLVAFNYGGPNDFIWWNIAGWSNTQHAIEVSTNGSKTQYDIRSGSIETGRKYHGKIILEGDRLICQLDGATIHDITLPTRRNLYISSNIDDEDGTLYVKVVNYSNEAQDARINLSNAKFVSAETTVMTASNSEADNTTSNMTNVAPVAGSVDISGNTATFNAPAWSLTILKFKVSDINKIAGEAMTQAEVAEVKASLSSLQNRLNHLRSHAALPTTTADGANISWTLDADAAPELTMNSSLWSSRLELKGYDKGDSEKAAGTLIGNITTSEGATGSMRFPITLAPSDGMYGYLYTYMSSAKEITNYALGSKEDKGRIFNHLINGSEIFDTEALAGIEHGTRDAYMKRGERAAEYFMTTTDMSNAKSGNWFNHGLDLLRSSDFIHWESSVFDFRNGKKIFSDPEATTDLYKTDAEYANINRVWAPQFIWDPEALNGKGAYLVYYSVLSSNSGDTHDRIVYSYADADFKTLTQPRLFYDPGYSVIDADIVYNEYDGLYHMWIKHEGANGADRGVYQLTAPKLTGETWKEISHVTNEGSELVEGSSTIRRIDEDDWNLYYMRYSGGSAYKVCDTDHEGLNVAGSSNLEGTGNFQHGSFMTLTEAEYKMLASWDELRSLMDWAKETGSPIFKEALEYADKALEADSVEELSAAIPDAIDKLNKAREQYIAEIAASSENGDITSLIQNPDFKQNNGNGWKGTTFTATSAGVAEHWNKTFDTYQELSGMPAGTYVLQCSGFYRYGGKEAYDSHVDGTEKLLASLYLNEESEPFMSLYDESTSYTGNPYNFPDNVSQANTAFNTRKFYGDNRVTLIMREPGNMRLGIRKTEAKGSDWTCFDNFRLFYRPDFLSVDEIESSENAIVDVVSLTGVVLKKEVTAKEAVNGLLPGIYIIGGKKVAVK